MSRMMLNMVNRMFPSSSFDGLRQFARLSSEVGFERKVLWNAFSHSAYAYGLLHACRQAARLGIETVSALELGVAGGNGLVALEKHATAISKLTGVSIRIFGFDTGAGLPPPRDYRDMPYFFGPGDFRMDEARLRERLRNSELVLGDVGDTFPGFLRRDDLPPIAFVAFDMDYYHPTRLVLDEIAACPDDAILPRPFLYFDNTVGTADTLYNEFAGELLAIAEFNAARADMKIALDRSLQQYNINFPWFRKIHVLHRFRHAMYSRYIGNQNESSLALK